MKGSGPPISHPFLTRPHRTLVALTWPVLLSLIAEPLAGVADTAFVARLGPVELAALGISTTLLSGIFWVFAFLGIGAQTELARALGAGRTERARSTSGLVVGLALLIGTLVAALSLPLLPATARLMGADLAIEPVAVTYLRIRLLGLPGSLLLGACFGVLRGLQDMRSPLRVAAVVSGLNVVLDPILIFGLGPLPALGVAGAAWATALTQWLGGIWALLIVRRALGLSFDASVRDAVRLLVVGRDLFLRTGLLLLFLFLATRTATQAGADSGAAHQALRQIWLLTALLLDSYAAVAQSLIGYFLGADRIGPARRVASVACGWGFATGVALAVGMLLLEGPFESLLVPRSSRSLFAAAWWIAALAQPINALSFVTDGIHWGTGDYRYLRNGMLAATTLGGLGLLLIDPRGEGTVTFVWSITAAWTAVRSGIGLVRIWPAPGRSPLRQVREVG